MPIQFVNGVECVECPCCHGRGVLTVYDETLTPVAASFHTCTHCMGKRFIAVAMPKHEHPLRYFGEVPL